MFLLTGATGFVGGHIVRRLAQAGESVRCLARHPERAGDLFPRQCELAKGDVLDFGSISAAMQEARAVIHLVGIIRETKETTFDALHVRATRNVLRAAKEQGVPRFLHMSALGARPGAACRYHQTKWQAEEAVRASGLAYTIFRPSVIFGPEDEFINMLAKMIRLNPVLPRFGKGRIQPIWVEEVAACFAHSLQDDSTIGRAFELAGPEVFSVDELIDLLCRTLRKKRLRLPAPNWFLRAFATVAQLLPNPPLTREQLLMLGEDNTCDITEMQAVFGIAPRRLEDYLREHFGG